MIFFFVHSSLYTTHDLYTLALAVRETRRMNANTSCAKYMYNELQLHRRCFSLWEQAKVLPTCRSMFLCNALRGKSSHIWFQYDCQVVNYLNCREKQWNTCPHKSDVRIAFGNNVEQLICSSHSYHSTQQKKPNTHINKQKLYMKSKYCKCIYCNEQNCITNHLFLVNNNTSVTNDLQSGPFIMVGTYFGARVRAKHST